MAEKQTMFGNIADRIFNIGRVAFRNHVSESDRFHLMQQTALAQNWLKIQNCPEWPSTVGDLFKSIQTKAVATLSRRSSTQQQRDEATATLQVIEDMNNAIMEVIRAGRDADQKLKAMSNVTEKEKTQ